MRRTSATVLLFAFAAAAHGQISVVGTPFTGTHQEGFEGGNFGFAPCVPQRVFSNTADLCANSAHVTSGWGFMCSIFPHSGGGLFGSTGTPATYTFDNAVSKFGGYFGTNAGGAGGTAEFFDTAGASLGSQPITAPADCTWTWNGWQSTSANIKSVRITANNSFGGGFMDMDDMAVEAGGTVCYPDCNLDGALTVADFGCFQTAFVAGNMYADCNGDGALTVPDFGCFQTKFVAGCP